MQKIVAFKPNLFYYTCNPLHYFAAMRDFKEIGPLLLPPVHYATFFVGTDATWNRDECL